MRFNRCSISTIFYQLYVLLIKLLILKKLRLFESNGYTINPKVFIPLRENQVT